MDDFNYNLLEESHQHTRNFVDIVFNHSFYPIISRPNRITPTSSKCFDHIWIMFM